MLAACSLHPTPYSVGMLERAAARSQKASGSIWPLEHPNVRLTQGAAFLLPDVALMSNCMKRAVV